MRKILLCMSVCFCLIIIVNEVIIVIIGMWSLNQVSKDRTFEIVAL